MPTNASFANAPAAELPAHAHERLAHMRQAHFFTSDLSVSEFLLVPWVGACIHTPPPPPNQIVHVKPEKPVEMSGMFAPVWVTGKMTTGAIKKSLSLVDGSADIDVGYSLRASRVEPYKE